MKVGSTIAFPIAKHTLPHVVEYQIRSAKMFDGKYNEMLDSLAFRMGVHTLAFWGWMAIVLLLLGAAARGF